MVQGWPGQKHNPTLKITEGKGADWRHGLSGRVPAQQAQGPEFKPQY
jgi:hypothetical protein